MKKRVFYTELSYVFGLIVIALGVSLMEKSDFGVSMVVAPAYVLYRWIGPHWPVFTFGMAEYCLQAVLILLMSALLRRFRLSYLLSFATAVVYGLSYHQYDIMYSASILLVVLVQIITMLGTSLSRKHDHRIR